MNSPVIDSPQNRKEARSTDDDPLAVALYLWRNRTPEQIQADRDDLLRTARPGRPLPPGKTILDILVGAWPGDETDEQIHEALERLS